jgi:hypothetical protein
MFVLNFPQNELRYFGMVDYLEFEVGTSCVNDLDTGNTDGEFTATRRRIEKSPLKLISVAISVKIVRH